MPLDDGARSLLRNGLMQNDLDANFHKILNLDLTGFPAVPPDSFPPVANQFLNSYDAIAHLFTSAQPDITGIAGFPNQTGQADKFLKTNGTNLLWDTPSSGGSGGGSTTYINVKDAPYNAQGDGVTDDLAAINAAIADAGGRTVYFPKGIYYISGNLAPTGAVTLVGDSASASILKANPAGSFMMLLLQPNSSIYRLGFFGNNVALTQTANTTRIGIATFGTGNITIRDCFVFGCAGHGIVVQNSFDVMIQACAVDTIGGNGIYVINSPRTSIDDTHITNCGQTGAYVVNSQQSILRHNSVSSCFDYGIFCLDSDNSVVDGNIVQQNATGILIGNSPTHPSSVAFGYSVSSNNIIRNYYGGVILSLSSGILFSGNNVLENGAGVGSSTFSIERGATVDDSRPDSGYQVGDILTVVGGTGTAAKLLVTKMDPGDPTKIAWDGLMVLSYGNYTVFPANPVDTTGGIGTGAKVILTQAIIAAAGTGYTVGQCLRATNGTFNNPVRLAVISVNDTGGITGFGLLDGGGYTGTLPTALDFVTESTGSVGEGVSMDIGASGTGFQLTPSFGRRYAQYQGATPFGVQTLGAVVSGIIGSNVIDSTRNGVGFLTHRLSVTGYDGYAQLLCVTGNSILNLDPATFSIKAQLDNDPVDDDYNHFANSIFANNILFP